MRNKRIGARGEDIACAYLISKGYAILERNYRTSYGEIDIICLDGQHIVAIEVKTRRTNIRGNLEEAISVQQTLHYIHGMIEYMSRARHRYDWNRIDAILIQLDPHNDTVLLLKHYKNIPA